MSKTPKDPTSTPSTKTSELRFSEHADSQGHSCSHDSKHAHGHEHGNEHNHEHGHSHGFGSHVHFHGASLGSQKALIRSLQITFAFMLLEALGGYFGNSLALLSDALHMLTDAAAMAFSLFVLWLSQRPARKSHSYGYHRVEILGALASGLSLWVIAAFLIAESMQRFQSPEPVQGPMVFAIAAIGLVANLFSMRALHGAAHHNLNVKAAYLHVLSDLMGSVCALIAGLVVWTTGWSVIDPLLTFVFAGLMAVNAWPLIRESIQILMESAPPHLDLEEIRRELLKIPSVQELHDLHVWQVGSGRIALSVHLISNEAESVLKAARTCLEEHFGIVHCTIQIESPDQFDRKHCFDCETKG